VRSDDAPVQLLADQGKIDQLHERRLKSASDLFPDVTPEWRQMCGTRCVLHDSPSVRRHDGSLQRRSAASPTARSIVAAGVGRRAKRKAQRSAASPDLTHEAMPPPAATASCAAPGRARHGGQPSELARSAVPEAQGAAHEPRGLGIHRGAHVDRPDRSRTRGFGNVRDTVRTSVRGSATTRASPVGGIDAGEDLRIRHKREDPGSRQVHRPSGARRRATCKVLQECSWPKLSTKGPFAIGRDEHCSRLRDDRDGLARSRAAEL
jgi:hypothetical protein